MRKKFFRKIILGNIKEKTGLLFWALVTFCVSTQLRLKFICFHENIPTFQRSVFAQLHICLKKMLTRLILLTLLILEPLYVNSLKIWQNEQWIRLLDHFCYQYHLYFIQSSKNQEKMQCIKIQLHFICTVKECVFTISAL